MHHIKLVFVISLLAILSGCASIECKPQDGRAGYALPGTNTAVVGISLDQTGTPQVQVQKIVLYPGQKVLFAGPDRFSIFFKNRKTPNGKIENPSGDGVVVIAIPENILEQKEFVEEFRKNDSLTFNYGIRVNGKELDPEIIVKRPH
jgi:hypothetical protein